VTEPGGLKFSVITCTRNSAASVRDTIESVRIQEYRDLEHIFVDGNSSDATLGIVTQHGIPGTVILKEPVPGIYRAINRGIVAATGDVIAILHADDFYADLQVLRDVSDLLQATGADCLFADMVIVSKNDTRKILRHWKTGPFKPGAFAQGWHPPHPAFFVRKSIHERYGLYDTGFAIAADFDLVLRLLEKERISSCYLERPVVCMRHGGFSTGSLKNIILGNLECIRAFRNNSLRVGPAYMLYRSRAKLAEFRKARFLDHRPAGRGSIQEQ
jgi:glycosyltransferase